MWAGNSVELEFGEKVKRMSDDRYLVAVELKQKHIDILNRFFGGGEDYWDDLKNISDGVVELIESVGEMYE